MGREGLFWWHLCSSLGRPSPLDLCWFWLGGLDRPWKETLFGMIACGAHLQERWVFNWSIWHGKPSLFQDWIPQGDVVVDSNGNTVEGVVGWGNNLTQCGITIITAEEVHKYSNHSDVSNLCFSQKHGGNWYVRTTNIPTKPGGFFNLTLSLNTADEVTSQCFGNFHQIAAGFHWPQTSKRFWPSWIRRKHSLVLTDISGTGLYMYIIFCWPKRYRCFKMFLKYI